MCACCKSRSSKNFVLQELNTACYSGKQLRTTTELIQILDSNVMGTHNIYQGLGLYVPVVATPLMEHTYI